MKKAFLSIKDYKSVIDTGSVCPIPVKKKNSGPHKMSIMEEAITALAKLNPVFQIHDRPWLFKALFAPKSHQEHVTNIDSFVWHICVN